jgi:steroid 5-alpha reductase family enzyme
VVYFISIGYAFSIVAMAVATMILLRENLTWATALHNVLLALWGLRLGRFLVRRELQPSLGTELAATHQRTAGMPWSQKVAIWIGVSFLYVLMFSPSLLSMTTPAMAEQSLLAIQGQWIGLAIMAGALVMESVANRQKSAFKTQFPRQFCNVGPYRWVRCPNYLGEVLFLGWQLGDWPGVLHIYPQVGSQPCWAGLHRAFHARLDQTAGGSAG